MDSTQDAATHVVCYLARYYVLLNDVDERVLIFLTQLIKTALLGFEKNMNWVFLF